MRWCEDKDLTISPFALNALCACIVESPCMWTTWPSTSTAGNPTRNRRSFYASTYSATPHHQVYTRVSAIIKSSISWRLVTWYPLHFAHLEMKYFLAVSILVRSTYLCSHTFLIAIELLYTFFCTFILQQSVNKINGIIVIVYRWW